MIKVNGKEIEFTQFPNGETNMHIDNIKKTYLYHIEFKYENDSDLIKLLFVKEYIDNLDTRDAIKIINLSIYYMMYSRMDRSENGSPFTLKYITKFINGMNFNRVTTVEPHSNVTPALLDKSVSNYINFELVSEVIEDIGFDINTDFIMFPDAGAQSRYKHMKYSNVLIGHKNRDFKTGDIKGLNIIGDVVNPNKVLIVDDLSSYGGTFIHSSKKLKELGFKEVYLLVAHAENSIFKKDLFDHVDKVFTTDSMITEHNNWENVKFEPQLKIFKMEDYLID